MSLPGSLNTTDDVYELDPLVRAPHSEAARLRERGKIVRVAIPTDGHSIGAWVITDYAAAEEMLGDARFSKNAKNWRDLQEGKVPHIAPMVVPLTSPSMIALDPPDHTRLRQFATKALAARTVQNLVPFIESVTSSLLARVADTPPGQQIDLRAEFAAPLPVEVLFHVLGVPDDDRRERWRDMFLIQISSVASVDEIQHASAVITEELRGLIADKRAHPGKDLISTLIEASDASDKPFAEDEILGTVNILILAGYETTINSISNGVCALADHPDQLTLVRSGQATWSDAVEETLRWDSPVLNVAGRYPLDTRRIGGQLVRAGDLVIYSPLAIGHDPGRYGPDANQFIVTRREKHLGFGRGIHACPGAALARLETEIALKALFTRLPDLKLAIPRNKLRRNPNLATNSLATVPVIVRPLPSEGDV